MARDWRGNGLSRTMFRMPHVRCQLREAVIASHQGIEGTRASDGRCSVPKLLRTPIV